MQLKSKLLAIGIVLLLIVASFLTPTGQCQGAQCTVTSFTVWSTIYQTLTQSEVQTITQTYTTNSTTTTTVYTTTAVVTQIVSSTVPGGYYANLTCQWNMPNATSPSITPLSWGNWVPVNAVDFISLGILMAAAGMALQGENTRMAITMFAAAIMISLLSPVLGGATSIASVVIVILAGLGLLMAWRARK